MKRFRGLFLILCLSCMLLVSACSTAPHVSGPVRMALALEEESELLVLEAPTPTAEPPEPTPEPAAEPVALSIETDGKTDGQAYCDAETHRHGGTAGSDIAHAGTDAGACNGRHDAKTG